MFLVDEHGIHGAPGFECPSFLKVFAFEYDRSSCLVVEFLRLKHGRSMNISGYSCLCGFQIFRSGNML
jgi:hypothetical protein